MAGENAEGAQGQDNTTGNVDASSAEANADALYGNGGGQDGTSEGASNEGGADEGGQPSGDGDGGTQDGGTSDGQDGQDGGTSDGQDGESSDGQDGEGQPEGVPEAPDGYKVKLAEGRTVFKPIVEIAQKFAHKHKLPQEAFDDLVNGWEGMVADLEAQQAAEIQKQKDTIAKEWGPSTRDYLSKTEKFMTKVFSKEFVEFSKTSGLALHPTFVKEMFELSKHFAEDTTTAPDGSDRRELSREERLYGSD